jgi:hypothetical protein
MALQYSTACRNGRGDAVVAAVGGAGFLRIWTGSLPGNCAAPDPGTKLSEDLLASPFAPATAGGVSSPTIPSNVSALATGTAGYWRVYTSGGTCVVQGTVGLSVADMILNTLSFVAGDPVQVNSWTWTEGGA